MSFSTEKTLIDLNSTKVKVDFFMFGVTLPNYLSVYKEPY